MVGASYTDIHVGLPALWLLIGLSIIAAWANVRVRSFRIPLADGRTFATVIPGQNRPARSENLDAELSATAMSAFGGKADIAPASQNVRL